MDKLLADLGMSNTPSNALYAQFAIYWVNQHTTLKIALDGKNEIPAAVKLFVLKCTELLALNTGVASESISGLSQSFVTGTSLEARIYELAIALLGLNCIKSTVTVYSGESKWDYGR